MRETPGAIICPTCEGSGAVPTEPLVARLRAKTIVRGDCWEYGKGANRYQTLVIGTLRVAVHRLSHLIWHGSIAGDVLHSCDNKRCWNPEHLRDGDALANNRDRRERSSVYGRAGAANHFARLTAEQVEVIRGCADTRGMLPRARAKELAAQYGVHLNTIYRAFVGKTWRTDTRVKPEARSHWSQR